MVSPGVRGALKQAMEDEKFLTKVTHIFKPVGATKLGMLKSIPQCVTLEIPDTLSQ